MKQKLFAMVLTACMLLSLLPTAALAEETGAALGQNGLLTIADSTGYTADYDSQGWKWEQGVLTLKLPEDGTQTVNAVEFSPSISSAQIVLESDVTLDAGGLTDTVPLRFGDFENQTGTLTLNASGHTLTLAPSGSAGGVTCYGNLTISGGAVKSSASGHGAALRTYGGTLTVTGGAAVTAFSEMGYALTGDNILIDGNAAVSAASDAGTGLYSYPGSTTISGRAVVTATGEKGMESSGDLTVKDSASVTATGTVRQALGVAVGSSLRITGGTVRAVSSGTGPVLDGTLELGSGIAARASVNADGTDLRPYDQGKAKDYRYLFSSVVPGSYTISQNSQGEYTVVGDASEASYTLVENEPSFQTTIDTLFGDVKGDGTTIRLGGDVTIAGDTQSLPEGAYPTTGVGEGWITWDLQNHEMTLENICMLADADGILTVKNGSVAYTGDGLSQTAALFGAQANGQLILEGVTASRLENGGGGLLGAYPTGGKTGASVTVTNCDMTSGDTSTYGQGETNVIYVGENSSVTLNKSSFEGWVSEQYTMAYVAEGGELALSNGSTLAVNSNSDASDKSSGAGILSDGGTVRLADSAVNAGPALRNLGNSRVFLSGAAQVSPIDVSPSTQIDAKGYTGSNVKLSSPGEDILYGQTLVTGCADRAAAEKFSQETRSQNLLLGYEEQSDGTWNAVATALPLSGTDTSQSSVYSISSKEELEQLAKLVNSGKQKEFCGFLLTQDIDLEGSEENPWTPIGFMGMKDTTSKANAFVNWFDGGGHTISGLVINAEENDPHFQGLFGALSKTGVVRNLTVTGTVKADRYAGGTAGCNEGKIENCVSNVSFSGKVSNYGGDFVGGLVSENASGGVILNCVNNSAVRGVDLVGGIVGDNHGTVTGCQNNGAILAGERVGGIAGRSIDGSIVRCQNNGSVSFYKDAIGQLDCGGIAGYVMNTAIENCVNTGSVTLPVQTGPETYFIGGIAGETGGGTVKNCYNTGSVSSAGRQVGGVVGYVSGTTVTNCVSLGLSVSGGESVGRVAGTLQSGALSANFARADMKLIRGGSTEETAAQDGIDGESITLSGDWQKTAFAGWDFDTIWNEGEGDSLPALKAVTAGPITLPRPASTGGSSRPSASVDGEGGTVEIGNGTVTIIPDEGYQIAAVTVNGKEVDIPKGGKLTGLKPTDKVVVTFEKIPAVDMGKFTDLDKDAWYYDAAEYAVQNGLFYGTGDTRFSPNAAMTRAMLMTVLARADGQDTTAPEGGKWYNAGMSWAMEQGISDGSDPDGSITREQVAAMLYRYAGSPTPPELALDFTDADRLSDYADSAMHWAVGEGIVSGKGGGILDPLGRATRAEAAAMLMRYLENTIKDAE